MRVYIDTGLFIDYLSRRGLVAAHLRSQGRRGRSLEQVFDDAEKVLSRIAARHEGATSALTFYEVEEATYKSLVSATRGTAHADVYRIAAARATVAQTRIASEFFNMTVLDLTAATVDAQLRSLELQTQGIRAADALHVATALRWDANLILSTDDSILALDNLVRNEAGELMRCYDSHDALRAL